MPNGSDAGTALPRWDLASIYPSFDSPEYKRDKDLLAEQLRALSELLARPLPETDAGQERPAEGAVSLRTAVLALIHAYEKAGDLAENLEAYAEAVYTADTRDPRALAEINALEALSLPLGKAAVLFRARLTENQNQVLSLIESGAALKPYGFFIRESLEKAAFQMGADLEDLANDLSRSGGEAWRRLHEAVSSVVSAVWDHATGERKTVVALRNLAMSPDRAVREKAYKAELEAWKAVEIPLAAALNGVKGTAITLDSRRGWKALSGSALTDAVPANTTGDGPISGGFSQEGFAQEGFAFTALGKSAFQSRLSGKTLGALIAALESSLPVFRRYLKAKAAVLGFPVCAFYDLFAPVGNSAGKRLTWDEAAVFIAGRFDAFDPEMGAFARRAFTSSWIDAGSRERKVGGAYCVDFPLAGESRILCNFEGSFDSVITAAHELGHAWHHEIIKDLPRSLTGYPMTLAETASIFAETIVFEGALSRADGEERIGLIEGNLKDSCQVVVDILSRFYFEREVFNRRETGELSPAELCALMVEAQEKTYGDGLDSRFLHPYMWAVKSHYYSPSLAFYNYPYAFGLLFSLGLYSRCQKEGPGFAATYRELLRLTGQTSAEHVAKAAGFDIESETFWREGLKIISMRVEEFESLTGIKK
jgi:oligoendopeptidase F